MHSIGGYSFEEVNDSVVTDVMFPVFPEGTVADVGVVLGAGIASLALLRKAADALEKGQVGFLVLSGGAVVQALPETQKYRKMFESVYSGDDWPRDGETEAVWMARCLSIYLKERGLPENCFRFESDSLNTKQNFEKLEEMPEYRDAGSVNLFAMLPTRALMTMRNIGSGKDKIAVLTDLFPFAGISRETWTRDEGARELVMFEFSKINPANAGNYLAKGDCVDIDLKNEIEAARGLRVPEGRKRFDKTCFPGV